MNPSALDHIAKNLLDSFGTAKVLPKLTEHHIDFTIDDGFAVAHRIRDLRVARGERVLGRKIGGTNPKIYHLTGATGPTWNFMYDTTVADLPGGVGTFAPGNFRQSRIEPEMVLHLATAPRAGMSEAEMLGCVDKVAHGFEFVYSPFADWKVPPADAAAAFGLHQAALLGPWHDISADRGRWSDLLKTVAVTLRGGNGDERSGTGANALGSPVLALRAIVEDIARHPDWTPIAAGEIVTTGTLTELRPALAGETWTTQIVGAPLDDLRVVLT